MTAPQPNFICKICGRIIPSFERVIHELNCKNSQNNNVLRMIDRKNNISSKTNGNINNLYNYSLSYTGNICGEKKKKKKNIFFIIIYLIMKIQLE